VLANIRERSALEALRYALYKFSTYLLTFKLNIEPIIVIIRRLLSVTTVHTFTYSRHLETLKKTEDVMPQPVHDSHF